MSLAMDSYSIPVAVLGLARLRDFDMNTFGLFTFSVKFERNCEFDLFCKFKVKMTRRSKVMKELKNRSQAMAQAISDGKNKQSKPTNSPTTPIHLKKEKPGPSNPTGNTSAY